jgi:hypothetical protein
MSRKLIPAESEQIVRQAIEDVMPGTEIAPDQTLGNLLPQEKMNQFRRTLVKRTRDQEFAIDVAGLRITNGQKVKDLANDLAELAGDPYTTKPAEEPPDLPTPKGDKPKYPRPGKKEGNQAEVR